MDIRAQDSAGKDLSGTASYRKLDQITGVPGEPMELGPLPLQARALPPGFYRFILEVDGQPFREYTRLLLRGKDASPIVGTLRPDVDPLAGMVRIEGDVLRPRSRSEDQLCPFLDHATPVAAFWIDASEVSVRQYRAFLAATGKPPPDDWQWLPADGRYEDRPAVCMSW